jgi:hypothetical protein
MWFCGGKDEFYVGRRLFKRLEKRVEGARGKHVDFVDDEDFESATGGKIFDILPELPDILDTGVGRPVDLENVHRITSSYLKAGRAGIAWLRSRTMFALEGFGENAGSARLPDASSPRKKKGMGNTAGLDCILQRPADMLLTDKILKCLGTPFSR